MVDKQKRIEAACLLRRLADGEISNDEFDDAYPESPDPAIKVIWRAAWLHWDDRFTHRLVEKHALTTEQDAMFERCIAFLGTCLEYNGPNLEVDATSLLKRVFRKLLGEQRVLNIHDGGDEYYWPFANEEEYRLNVSSEVAEE